MSLERVDYGKNKITINHIKPWVCNPHSLLFLKEKRQKTLTMKYFTNFSKVFAPQTRIILRNSLLQNTKLTAGSAATTSFTERQTLHAFVVDYCIAALTILHNFDYINTINVK